MGYKNRIKLLFQSVGLVVKLISEMIVNGQGTNQGAQKIKMIEKIKVIEKDWEYYGRNKGKYPGQISWIRLCYYFRVQTGTTGIHE